MKRFSRSLRPRRRAEEGYDDNVTGDVKYHHGARGVYDTFEGKQIAVILASNPSHLEAVNGVVEGLTRAIANVPR